MMTTKKILLLIATLLLLVSVLEANTDKTNLKVGFEVMPPFIIKTSKSYIGVSVELWDKVADSLNVSFTYVEYELSDLLKAVETGEVDIAISPLTVTSSRIRQFGFTQPYYITNLAYATRSEEDNGVITLISNIFSISFIRSLLPLLIIISIFGFFMWLLERKNNSEQFGKGIPGVADGIWWSAVTMATVGYGDKAPITRWGRVISIIWMFTAVIMISGLTASISSSLTVHRLKTEISSFEDLRKSKVGCIQGSGSSDVLDRNKIGYKNYNSVNDGIIAVNKGNIDAFVYDEAVLSYYVNKSKFDESIQVIPSSYSKEYFSFASSDSELLSEIDLYLLGVIESYDWELDLKKYNIEYRK